MSRVAKKPIEIPSGVEISLGDEAISVKGPKGQIETAAHPAVRVHQDGNVLTFQPSKGYEKNWAMAGTMRALVNNMVIGVTAGFERRLTLVGVGYRAQVQGPKLNLSLGFSHPIEYVAPTGIAIETPSQTEVVVRGVSKQQVGQVAAEIRAYRPPEPYKGKGVKYSNERILRKEAKKK